jgi:S-adenosylmethionine-diacylglycerol 3-amino-3-carboxypropyl transferase
MNAIRSAALIRDAVDGSTEDGTLARSNRRFTQLFDRLVYNQIWEDPVVDMAAMDLQPHHRVVTICSAGCNALSYLTADPAAVFAVDLNTAHLALAELKRAAFDAFEAPDTIRALFVNGHGAGNGAMIRERLLLRLSAASRSYWLGGFTPRLLSFEKGFYRRGLLGQAIALARLLARMHRVELSEVLALDDAPAQRDWARRRLRPIFESRPAAALFSLRHPLFMLGIPPRQFQLLCGGEPRRMAGILADRVEQLAGVARSSENYFMWQAFGSGYAPGPDAALPLYLQRQNFAAMKKRIHRLTFHHESITEHLAKRHPASLDRFVLLDAQDWMDDPTLRTAGPTAPFAPLGGAGAWRSWRRLDALSNSLHQRDRSGIYGGFHVYELAA